MIVFEWARKWAGKLKKAGCEALAGERRRRSGYAAWAELKGFMDKWESGWPESSWKRPGAMEGRIAELAALAGNASRLDDPAVRRYALLSWQKAALLVLEWEDGGLAGLALSRMAVEWPAGRQALDEGGLLLSKALDNSAQAFEAMLRSGAAGWAAPEEDGALASPALGKIIALGLAGGEKAQFARRAALAYFESALEQGCHEGVLVRLVPSGSSETWPGSGKAFALGEYLASNPCAMEAFRAAQARLEKRGLEGALAKGAGPAAGGSVRARGAGI